MNPTPLTDLRAFLDVLRREGELRVIDAEVDPDLEAAEVHRRVIAAGGPFMVGAIAVFGTLNLLVHRRSEPVLGGTFPGPRSKGKVNARVLAGAAVFGAGWGLSGVCPGPAIADVSTLQPEVFAYLGAMAPMALVRIA